MEKAPQKQYRPRFQASAAILQFLCGVLHLAKRLWLEQKATLAAPFSNPRNDLRAR
jgi:hypothetical protein